MQVSRVVIAENFNLPYLLVQVFWHHIFFHLSVTLHHSAGAIT